MIKEMYLFKKRMRKTTAYMIYTADRPVYFFCTSVIPVYISWYFYPRDCYYHAFRLHGVFIRSWNNFPKLFKLKTYTQLLEIQLNYSETFNTYCLVIWFNNRLVLAKTVYNGDSGRLMWR